MLDNRHIEALNLLKAGLSQKEVAEKIGVQYQTLRHWCIGDPALGVDSVAFGEEYKSYRKEVSDEIKQNVEDTLQILSRKFKVWAGQVVGKRATQEETKIATNLYRTLEETVRPKSDITNIYNIGIKTSGDALNEFKRYRVLLGGNGKGTPDSRGIRALDVSGAAGLLEPDKVRVRNKKTSKGGKLHSEPEAGSIPSVESSDQGDLRGE